MFVRDIKALTGIRGYAAVWVCVHHYAYPSLGANDRGLLLNFLTQGHWGVFVFFVLSGFLLAYVYSSWFSNSVSSRQYFRFVQLRVARVYPLHFSALCLWLAAWLLGFIGLNSNDTFYTFVLNLLLVHAWGFTSEISWNQPSWSISTELFSYLLFPFFFKWVNAKSFFACVVICVLLLFSILHPPHVWIVKRLFDIYGYKLVIKQFDYGLSVITWFYSFAFGVVVFLQAKRSALSALSHDFLVVCGVGLIVFMLATVGGLNGGEIAMGVSFASGLVIYGIYNESRVGGIIFGNALSVSLGRVSYSLYLTHIMFPLIINRAFNVLFHGGSFYDLPVTAQLIVGLILSYFTYKYFELPFRSYLRSKVH